MTVPLHVPDICFFCYTEENKAYRSDMEQHEVDGDNRIYHLIILAVNTLFNT